MTDMVHEERMPRHYLAGLSDADLIAARDEYRTTDDPYLLRVADDIDDDLRRRAAEREETP